MKRINRFALLAFFVCLFAFVKAAPAADNVSGTPNFRKPSMRPLAPVSSLVKPVESLAPAVAKVPVVQVPENTVRTYKVEKGDTLWGISRKYGLTPYGEIWKANKGLITNPHRIQIGWVLKISEKGSKAEMKKEADLQVHTTDAYAYQANGDAVAAAAVKAKESKTQKTCRICHVNSNKVRPIVRTTAMKLSDNTVRAFNSCVICHKPLVKQGGFAWRKPGANPFTAERDAKQAIQMFNLKPEVKAAFLEALATARPELVEVKIGERFNQIFFGHYKILNHVRAAWKASDNAVFADSWTVKVGGKKYELIRPWICSNWAWRIVSPEIKPQPRKKHPIVPPVKPPVERPEPPPFVPEQPVVPPPVVVKPMVHIRANPATINKGDCTNLYWQSGNVDTATIDQGIGPVELMGEREVCPTKDTVYTIVGRNKTDSATDSTRVTVVEPEVKPPTTVTPPSKPPVEEPEPEKVRTRTPSESVPEEEGYNWQYNPEMESSAFTWAYHGIHGDSRNLGGGINANLFPGGWQQSSSGDRYRTGLSGEVVGWSGRIKNGEDIGFHGNKKTVGVVGQHLTGDGSEKTSVALRLGKKENSVATPSGYQSYESATILNFDTLYTKFDPNEVWWPGYDVGVSGDIDIGGHTKEVSSNGVPISQAKDPSRSATEFSGHARAYISNKDPNLIPFVQGDATHSVGNENNNDDSLEFKVGFKALGGVAEAAAGYRIQEGSHNDSYGVGLTVDPVRGAKYLWFLLGFED